MAAAKNDSAGSESVRVRDLVTTFPYGSRRVAVVDQVSFGVAPGEVLALVGESGCGKSMTALSMLRLVPKPGRVEGGSVRLGETEVLELDVPAMRRLRGHQMAMIFQEPMSSLNPVQAVGAQVVEAILLHEDTTVRAARKRTVELFAAVGIPDPRTRIDAYPHQLSGGLKQRVMIAMALALRPTVLLADEPTTALDVTIQAQILRLMRELQRDTGTAILLITHDLGVVNEMADRVAVMYGGKIVEMGNRRAVLGEPSHPYTRGLLAAMPGRARRGEPLHEITGVVPQPAEWQRGCRFASRCPERLPHCTDQPAPRSEPSPAREVFCHARVGAPRDIDPGSSRPVVAAEEGE
ncbi:MAG: ABC transporter ATP-binding protein [Polyangiaceae bacterium]|nr:ABC transporter ATP-binding protein [Polyangiaceae bacterium]